MADMRIDVGLSDLDKRQFVDFLRAKPAQIRTATVRGLRATLRTISAQAARELSQSSDLPVGIFKKSARNAAGHRVRQSKIKNDSSSASLWVGSSLVNARFIGKARRTKRGIVVGSGRFRRFYADTPDAPKRLVERGDGHPSILWLNQRRRWESMREPVIVAPLDRVARNAKAIMVKNMRAQLNFILNHARGRYQTTGLRG